MVGLWWLRKMRQLHSYTCQERRVNSTLEPSPICQNKLSRRSQNSRKLCSVYNHAYKGQPTKDLLWTGPGYHENDFKRRKGGWLSSKRFSWNLTKIHFAEQSRAGQKLSLSVSPCADKLDFYPLDFWVYFLISYRTNNQLITNTSHFTSVGQIIPPQRQLDVSHIIMTRLADHEELNIKRNCWRFFLPSINYLIMRNVWKVNLIFGDGFVSVTNLNYCQTKNKIFMNIFTILGVGFCPHVI